MTLKYESEILFDLMKRDGDDAPSDVLPYESELKEKYLEQVEGAYPKLTDYRSEWLNYNLYAHLPADFPLESVSNVTNATFENVVPYAYRSAILKGQTLVNLLDLSQWGKQEKITLVSDGTGKRIDLGRNLPIKPNTNYLTIIPIYENTINHNFTIGGWGYFKDQPKITTANRTGIIKIIKTTKDVFSDNLFYLELWKENTSGQITFGKPMFIEYQDGMENWDISYFEGMKSIQTPVLRTVGKNLLNPNTYEISWAVENLIKNDDSFTLDITEGWGGIQFKDLKLKPNTNYTFKFETNKSTVIAFAKNSGQENQGGKTEFTFTTGNTGLITLSIEATNPTSSIILSNIQLEEGDIATTYEPYQSNILTSPKDLELHGIGDVRDELNLLTGELTQRIGEVVLNGSEKWFGTSENYRVEIPNVKGYKNIKWGQKSAISNLYPPFEGKETDFYIISEWEGNQIRIRDVNTTLEELKTKLSKNPLHVIFLLNEETVKTVGLTVTDQYGNDESIIRPLEGTMHVSTSSQTLPPLLDMSVPVEATTQNLMSFANIEEEEK